jgi:hypothetical protein
MAGEVHCGQGLFDNSAALVGTRHVQGAGKQCPQPAGSALCWKTPPLRGSWSGEEGRGQGAPWILPVSLWVSCLIVTLK